LCAILSVKPLQPISDIKTRWNSTYFMIDRALFLREVRIFFKLFLLIII